MSDKYDLLSIIRNRLSRLSIFHRIFIGNSVIIIFGAVGGTLTTHHFADMAADIWLISIFSTIGIILSVLTNFIIIKNALNPLYQLRRVVDLIKGDQARATSQLMAHTDPDILKLATAIDDLLNQLRARTLQLAALSERAINVQEEERKRIARELHDETGQALSMLIIGLERVENQTTERPEELKQQLTKVRILATQTLKDLRNVIYGLRPSMLDDLGLIPAIRWYARTCLEKMGAEIIVNVSDETDNIAPQLKTALYRIVQEAINNIERHAEATTVTINLTQEDGELCLSILDDGLGFNLQQVSDHAVQQQKLGLIGIIERAELVGGTAEVTSTPGNGTRIIVSVPFMQRELPE